MDYLSSQYIDDQMNLSEKKIFVEKIKTEPVFYRLTLELLDQEQLVEKLPARSDNHTRRLHFFRPFGFAATGFATALILFFILFQPQDLPVPANRFIIFQPDTKQVELAGTFTDWQRIPMVQIGHTGYWELKLPVSEGEHRFAYILDNDRRIADPTILNKEADDFGGENSIINVEKKI